MIFESSFDSDGGPVIVVGAGPSGLAAAWRLVQQGYRPIVIEERDRVGGQLLTVKQDGFLMEAGTTILPGAYTSVMRLIDEIGLTPDLLPADSGMGFVRDGQMHMLRANHLLLDAARTKLLSTRSKLSAVKIGIDLLRVRNVLSYEDLSDASAFDTETPADYAARRGLSQELYDYLIDPIARGGAGVPGNRISVVEFFFLMEKVLGSKLYALREGYSQFPETLAAQLPDVRLNASVQEVRETPTGVEVTYRTKDGLVTESAVGAIVSSMGNRVPEIVPQLAPERAAFLKGLRYTSCISVNLALAKRPDAKPAFVVVPHPVSAGLFAVILEHNKVPGRCAPEKGLATLFTVNEWAEQHMDSDDETIVTALVAEAEKAIPNLGAEIEFSRVNRWNPVLVYSHPGLYREMKDFHGSRDRNSRIHLAGSYNSSGNVNTATVAGERAARELGEALRGRSA